MPCFGAVGGALVLCEGSDELFARARAASVQSDGTEVAPDRCEFAMRPTEVVVRCVYILHPPFDDTPASSRFSFVGYVDAQRTTGSLFFF